MPEEIGSRVLRLPGYGVYAWEAEEVTGTLQLHIRQTAPEPYYVCGGCGISVRDVHSWPEREVRDLPWGTWQIWVVVEVHRAAVETVLVPRLGGARRGIVSGGSPAMDSDRLFDELVAVGRKLDVEVRLEPFPHLRPAAVDFAQSADVPSS